MPENNNGRIKNIASFGDLVYVAGYGDRIFTVESYSYSIQYYRHEAFEEIIYDLTDVDTLEYLIAYQEDITVICKASEANEYLANIERDITDEIPQSPSPGIDGGWPIGYEYVGDMTFEEVPETMTGNKDKHRYDRDYVDDLLTELSDKMTLLRMFDGDGDDEFKERIEKRITEIKERIKATTEGKR